MSESKNIEQDLLEEIELLIHVVERICKISLNHAGIKTDGKGMRAMKLFTRQTLSSISLTKLLPSGMDEYESLDIPSFASITRNIIECFISIYYFGTKVKQM